MRLEQIKQVLEIARTGSFSSAARNLYMSQPNLSLSIKQLEDELNCQLFVRKSNGIIPTEEGQAVIEQMSIIDTKLTFLVNHRERPEDPKLRLRVAALNHNRAIPYFVQLTNKYIGSPVNFSFVGCNCLTEVIDKVATCQVDFAIIGIMAPFYKSTMARLAAHQIEYHSLMQHQKITAVMGPKCEYYHRNEPLTLEDLQSQTIVTFTDETNDPESSVYNTSQVKVNTRGSITVSSGSLFYELVNNTPAIGLVISNRSTNYQGTRWPDIRYLPITDYPCEAVTGWIKLRRLPLSDLAQELLDNLESAF